MSKLTKNQMIAHLHQAAVNNHTELQNQVFTLHKFLVEHPASSHTIDDKETVIQDAIELITQLTRK